MSTRVGNSASSETDAPTTQNDKPASSSRISISRATAGLLAALALGAVAAAALITWHVSKGHFGGSPISTFLPHPPSDVTASPTAPIDNVPTAADLRLPRSLQPRSYNLSIKTYLPGYGAVIPKEQEFTYDGLVQIKMFVASPTDKVVLSSVLSSIHAPDCHRVLSGKQPGVRVTEITTHPKLEMVTFHLDQQLKAGQELTLEIAFTGFIASSLEGFYSTSYNDNSGEKKWVAMTDFVPTDARRFVPCFDEPDMKATWSVHVTHPEGTEALGNGIELRAITGSGGWLSTSFADTPAMSTYVLAVFIGPFKYKEAWSKTGVRVRVYARPNAMNKVDHALSVAVHGLDYFEDYYQVKFPMAKLDLLGVQDFAAGAMENWGLMTFVETTLYYHSSENTLFEKAYTTQVIMHELAHQWFGNLVTMQWWSELWLNEGFASLLGHVGEDHYNPRFQSDDDFANKRISAALKADALPSSRPIIVDVEKVEDTKEIFDVITYSKGSSFLRTTKAVLGEENFKKGLNIYLNRHKWNNTRADDLWAALSEAVPDSLLAWDGKRFDVKEFADKWTLQMGFPVVNVKRVSGGVVVMQERFKRDKQAVDKEKYRVSPFGYKWDVPLFVTVNGEKMRMQWLHDDQTLHLPLSSPSDVFLLNADSLGFYRVNYDQAGWTAIARQLRDGHEKLSVKSRARVIDDAFALAESGDLPYETALDLISYLPHEHDFVAWYAAMQALVNLRKKWGSDADGKGIKEFMLSRLRPHYDTVDWDMLGNDTEEVYMQHRLRVHAILYMYGLGDGEVKNRLAVMYDKVAGNCAGEKDVVSECGGVIPALREKVYCEGVARGGETAVRWALNKFTLETEYSEKKHLLGALACTTNTYMLNTFLAKVIDANDTDFGPRNRADLIMEIASTSIGGLVIHDFFMQHIDEIENVSPGRLFNHEIDALPVRNEQKLKAYEHFLASNPRYAALPSFSKLLERGRHSVDFAKTHRQKLNAYFKKVNEAH